MRVSTAAKPVLLLSALVSLASLNGCASYEGNSGRGNIPGILIRHEMQDADRAVEAARQAGKDKMCPEEFKQAEATKNKAYDVYRACFTEEGVKLAHDAVAKANALCPAVMQAPPPEAPAVKVPEPAPAPPPPPAPVPAPTDRLTVSPDSIVRGQSATLTWTSQNASRCDIEPGIGPVKPQGSLTIAPLETNTYTLTCGDKGVVAKSSASITVTAPAPPPKLCSPTVIDVQFDTNKSDIKAKYHEELKKVADFLKEWPKARGVIEGHTDSVGNHASNMKLSQRRADSVRSYLIKNFGIDASRLEAKGYGPDKPQASNKTAEGRAHNRRIEANFTCD